MVKQITKEQIREIKNLMDTHNTIKAKIILDKLEPFEDILRGKLRRYLMNQGRSDIFAKDIWKILDETKLNNKIKNIGVI